MNELGRVAADGGFQRWWSDFAKITIDAGKAHAGAKEFRRTALVGDQMGFGVAKGDATRAPHRGDGQGVGGGAVEDEEDLAVGLEEFAQGIARPGCPFVVPVAGRMTLVRLLQGFPADNPGNLTKGAQHNHVGRHRYFDFITRNGRSRYFIKVLYLRWNLMNHVTVGDQDPIGF